MYDDIENTSIEQYLMLSQQSNKAKGQMADSPRLSTNDSLALNFGKEVEYTL